MTEIQETELPGVGIRYDFATRSGYRLGVIVHRTGERELIVYAGDDPDRCALAARLSAEEASSLAELLGGGRIGAQLAGLHQDIAGLAIDWLQVAPGATWAGRTLGEAAVHSKTGVSVVALLRGQEALAAPGPETVLQPGDTVVAVGTVAGLAEVAKHLRAG